MKRKSVYAALAFVSSVLFAQAPAFEVASIKQAAQITPAQMMSGQIHVGMTIDAARVDIGFWSLSDLIRTAYRVKPHQVTGPDWMPTQRFDIVAKIPEGASKEQVPEMLQALLAERFKLVIHRDSKEQTIYALVVAKGGPKLKEAALDSTPPPPPEGAATGGQMRLNRTANGMEFSGGPGGPVRMSMANGSMHMEAPRMTMVALAETLTPFLDRPVVDMTELKGNYQVALDLSMEDMRSVARMAARNMPGLMPGGEPPRALAEGAGDPSGSSIFASVQQLGLKLEPRKAPVEMIVVDHLEKAPSEN
jgi:uncharacterized protein (TIGR03435 family)